MLFLKKGQKLKFALFVNRLKLAINHKYVQVSVNNFPTLTDILLQWTTRGYIRGYTLLNKNVIIFLKYSHKGECIIKEIDLLTRTSNRNTVNYYKLQALTFHNTPIFTFFIISTNKGLMMSDIALEQKIGGQLVFKIRV